VGLLAKDWTFADAAQISMESGSRAPILNGGARGELSYDKETWQPVPCPTNAQGFPWRHPNSLLRGYDIEEAKLVAKLHVSLVNRREQMVPLMGLMRYLRSGPLERDHETEEANRNFRWT
jgi:hypothetical protein